MEKENRLDWKWWLLVIENSIILLIANIFILHSCSTFFGETKPAPIANYPGYDYMCIHAYPDKLTYVIGKDNALDLTGGLICYSEWPKKSECVACTASEKECSEVYSMASVKVVSIIDFEKEGTYLVTLVQDAWKNPIQCSFPIQVISPDYVE